MIIKFLEKEEYIDTIPLFKHCFGDDEEFIENYYAKDSDISIYNNEVVGAFDDTGMLLSMAHVKYIPVIKRAGNLILGDARTDTADAYAVPQAFYDAAGDILPYICCVGTLKTCRHRGLMDGCLKLVMESLKQKGYRSCFLVAENKIVYEHLEFIHDWLLHPAERDLLLAEEHNKECSGRLL